MNTEKPQHNGLGALFLIFLGIVFLLNNLNILPWNIWDMIWKLWPLALILVGVKFVLGPSRTSHMIVVLIGLLFILCLLLFVLASVNQPFHNWLNMYLPWLTVSGSERSFYETIE